MTAHIIDGKALSKKLRSEMAATVASLHSQGIRPSLTVVLAGDDPASAVYVRNKINACKEAGIISRLIRLPEATTQNELLQHIQQLNADDSVHGILVQLPLPRQINDSAVIEAIAAEKDVDGFHVANAGALLTGQPGYWPCTPHGCMKMLESIDYPIKGKQAVIVGRSNIVGKPMAIMLLERNATVTICHSGTDCLTEHTRRADILVAAVGRPNFITGDMIKPGAVVLDVGINRLPDDHPERPGKLCGDVDFASAKEVAGYITPVPGGVGPMTITMLLLNTLEAAQRLSHCAANLAEKH